MSRLLIVSLAAMSVVTTGCQKTTLRAAPVKSTPFQAIQPTQPPFQPSTPVPLPPPRYPQPEPVDPVQPLPRTPQPEPIDPVVVVEPPVPPTPVTPTTQVVPSERNVTTQVTQVTQPQTPVPPVPPVREEVLPTRRDNFNTYVDVPSSRPVPTRIVDTPAPAPIPRASGMPQKPLAPPVPAPTQVIQAPAPKRTETCVGPEGQECKPPKAEADQCQALPLKSTKKGKLDVLFVVDTSLSLRGGLSKEGGELAQLAREMENFVNELPLNTDIRVAVMLGHGPATKHHGRLFNAGSGDQTVINLAPAATKEERSKQGKLAGKILTNKMLKVPNESKGAQGEAMLLSLYDGVMNASRRNESIKAGMFRSDAALNVIIISDEQDVCFDYEAANKADPSRPLEPRKKMKKKAIKDAKGKLIRYEDETVVDPYEVAFFNNVCKKAVNGRPLTPGDVHQALISLKQDSSKLILSAIAYKTNNIPVGLEDENEMGHGIIDLVEHIGGGQVVDLATVTRNGKDVSFAKELTYLGKFAFFKITFTNEWDCQSNTHPAAVNKSSTRLTVVDRNGQTLASFNGADGSLQTLIATGGRGGYYSKFRVNHEALSKALQGKNTEGASVKIDFMTRTDIDRATGNKL